ncbi:unnamed protein product [Brassica oleracea]
MMDKAISSSGYGKGLEHKEYKLGVKVALWRRRWWPSRRCQPYRRSGR